jgi:hypothetical protein
MSSLDEIDSIIWELSASLPRPQHAAFEAAARTVLEGIPVLGVGVAYRTLAGLQRQYFDPPVDARTSTAGARHYRPNKLNSLPAIGIAEDPQGAARRRTLWARG